MTDKIYYTHLFDFYGDLLTDKQKDICDYYFNEDYSLQEIAENKNVSRSAIFDTIKHAKEEMDRYEEKLKLYSAFQKRSKIYEKMKKIDNKQLQKLVNECIKTEIEGGQNE